jgi:cytochrome P450 family 628
MATAIFLNLLAAFSGALAHLAVFRKGEWDVASPSVFAFYCSIFAAALLSTSPLLINTPIQGVTQIAICHVAGLYGSMLLYRAFFHRLSQYPGPFLARVTNFYITALSMKKLHLFEEVQKLHAQYGDYVRLGAWHSPASWSIG